MQVADVRTGSVYGDVPDEMDEKAGGNALHAALHPTPFVQGIPPESS